jgi:hypothetical protein
MNMHRSHSGSCLLVAAVMLGLLSVTPLAQGEPAGNPASTGAPADGAQAPAAAPSGPADAAAPPPGTPPAATPPAATPPAMATATAKTPATLVIDRQTAAGNVYLDLNVRAFRPPHHGAVEAVVTLEANKEGGREVDVGTFAIFPAKKFEAKKPEDERGFRLNATQALADLGADSAAVKVKVRLAPVRERQSAAGAKLTIGKAQFVLLNDDKDDKDDAK